MIKDVGRFLFIMVYAALVLVLGSFLASIGVVDRAFDLLVMAIFYHVAELQWSLWAKGVI